MNSRYHYQSKWKVLSSVILVALLILQIHTKASEIIRDDFDDGELGDEWALYDPLHWEGGIGPMEVTFEDGALRLWGPNPDPGANTVGIYRTDVEFADFYIAVDVLSWWDRSQQNLGLFARVGGIVPGEQPADSGFWTKIDDSTGIDRAGPRGLGIVELGGGEPLVEFRPENRPYRLVFEGIGSNLTSRLYHLEDLTKPVQVITHEAGERLIGGKIGFAALSGFFPGGLIDNFLAAESNPYADLLPEGAAAHGIEGAAQVIDKSPATGAEPIDAIEGIQFTISTLTDKKVDLTSIKLTLNDEDVSADLIMTLDGNNLTVHYDRLKPNQSYEGMLTMANVDGVGSTHEFALDTTDTPLPSIVIREDFDDGSLNTDTRWVVSEPMVTTFPDRGIRLQPQQQSLGTIVLKDLDLSAFYAAVDIVDWDVKVIQSFGFVVRWDPENRNGYAGFYDPINPVSDRLFAIDEVTWPFTPTLDSAHPRLDPERSYRMVLTGQGSVLTGALYDLADLTSPVATLETDRADRHASGTVGLFAIYFGQGQPGPQIPDVTFDNFILAESNPYADLLPEGATAHGVEGVAQVIARTPSTGAEPIDAIDGLRFTLSTLTNKAVDLSSIKLTLNDENVSNALSITPNGNNLTVRYDGLEPSRIYSGSLTMANVDGTGTVHEFGFETTDTPLPPTDLDSDLSAVYSNTFFLTPTEPDNPDSTVFNKVIEGKGLNTAIGDTSMRFEGLIDLSTGAVDGSTTFTVIDGESNEHTAVAKTTGNVISSGDASLVRLDYDLAFESGTGMFSRLTGGQGKVEGAAVFTEALRGTAAWCVQGFEPDETPDSDPTIRDFSAVYSNTFFLTPTEPDNPDSTVFDKVIEGKGLNTALGDTSMRFEGRVDLSTGAIDGTTTFKIVDSESNEHEALARTTGNVIPSESGDASLVRLDYDLAFESGTGMFAQLIGHQGKVNGTAVFTEGLRGTAAWCVDGPMIPFVEAATEIRDSFGGDTLGDDWTVWDPFFRDELTDQPMQISLSDRGVRLRPQLNNGNAGRTLGGLVTKTEWADFYVAFDLIDWDSRTTDEIGIAARVRDEDVFGGLDGYVCLYAISPKLFVIGEINDLGSSGNRLFASQEISLDPNRDYRLVFAGKGSLLSGNLYDLADLTTPIASLSTDRADRYDTGKLNLYTVLNNPTITEPADATFDNFLAAESNPFADLLAEGATAHGVEGAAQVVAKSLATDGEPIDAVEGVEFTVSTLIDEEVDPSSIKLTLNDEDVSAELAMTPDGNNLTVHYDGLQPNQSYEGTLTMANVDGFGSTHEFRFETKSAPAIAIDRYAITQIARNGSDMHITFDSVVGQTYALEASETLSQDWQIVETTTAESDTTIFTLIDSLAFEELRGFFRVRNAE